MWGRGILAVVMVVWFVTGTLRATGPEAGSGDTIQKDTSRNATSDKKTLITKTLDLAFSLGILQMANRPGSEGTGRFEASESAGFLLLCTKTDRLKFTLDLDHALGVQYFFDSITVFQPDETSLSVRLEKGIRKRILLAFSSVMTTRLSNKFSAGSLCMSFLTPLILTFSAGPAVLLPGYGSLTFGVTGAKLTYVSRSEVFDHLSVDSFFGVRRGKRTDFGYGLTLQLLIDRDLSKWIHWNTDLLIFKESYESADATWKNLFEFRITTLLKIILQSRILYDADITRKLQLENSLSAGITLNL